MATELVQIPLNAGAREDIDEKVLPQGLLKSAINIRLRKGGEIGVRHGFTALPMLNAAGETVKVYDVVSHNETLLAFGTTRANATGPEKVFTYLEQNDEWRGETHGTRPRAFSAISELKQVFRPSYAKTDEVQLYDLAYAGGYLALVYEDHADNGDVLVSIFDPETGSVLFEVTVADRTHPRVVGVGGVFVFAWQDASDDVRCATFTVASSTALSAETVVHNSGTVGNGIDLCAVDGASEAMLLVIRSDTNVGTIYRLNTSLTTLDSATLTATDVVLGSIESLSSGTTNVAYVRTGGAYGLESFTTSTLVSATGPTALFGGSTGSRPPTLIRRGASTLILAAAIPDTMDSQMKVDVRSDATHTASTTYTAREVSLQSKLFLSPDEQFCGVVSPYGEDTLVNFTGIYDVEGGRGYECGVHRGFAVDALDNWLGSVATDGTRHWAVFPVTDLNCSHTPVVMQFRANSPERRQTASLGGLLYVAGGFVGVWDGQRLVESGFLDTPIIESVTPSNGDGTLTPEATYSYTACREWYDAAGNRHLSSPSDPFVVTMGAGEDTCTVVVSSGHSVRRIVGGDQGSKIVLYRTLAAPDRFHRRTIFESDSATFAASASLVDINSDADIRSQEVVYTQGSRGTLSGPLPHHAPFSAEYITAKRDRLLNGGLPDRSQWQQSKRLFPGEPIEFSNTLGHFGSVRGRITGVASQDDVDLIFTRDEVFIVGGQGPDDNGGTGEFTPPRKLPGDSVGCINWRSIVATSKGVWFLAHPDRLYLIPRGGGAAEWLGQPVRDTLKAFPIITAATVVSQDNTVVWSVENTEGTEGRLIVHDLRSGDWYVDDLVEYDSAPVQAACEHLGRLVLVIDDEVYLQNTNFVADEFIPYEFTTAGLSPNGMEGWTKLVSFTLTGEYRGDCTFDALISYEDGTPARSAGNEPFDIVDYEVGDTISRQWFPYRRKGERFVIRPKIESFDGASEGINLTNLTLEIQRAPRAARKRKSHRK